MEKNNSLMGGKGENGKWITVNGSHIFVEDGQSIEDAMNKQFKSNNKVQSTSISKHQSKANYLKEKINNSWYANAKKDYGIDGKVKDITIDGDTINVVVEENGKTMKTKLPYAGEYTAEQLYNIWQEFPDDGGDVAPEKAKDFATGNGHLSENGGYQGVSNVKDAPKSEYKTLEQHLSKETEDWANTTLKKTVTKTPTENLKKLVGYWEEIYKLQNDAYSQKMLDIYGGELAKRN